MPENFPVLFIFEHSFGEAATATHALIQNLSTGRVISLFFGPHRGTAVRAFLSFSHRMFLCSREITTGDKIGAIGPDEDECTHPNGAIPSSSIIMNCLLYGPVFACVSAKPLDNAAH
jgi:hypothetical protein